MTKELYSRMRGAKVMQVIVCLVNEGEGIEGDPIQNVRYYYDLQGKFLFCDSSTYRKFQDDNYPE